MFVLVRHADAVATSAWPGLDADRPLSTLGDRQSIHLVDVLADLPVTALFSSPTLRCRQTLQALSVARYLPIVDHQLLTVDAPIDRLLFTLARSVDGALWCTHGEVFDRVAAVAADGGHAGFLPAATTAEAGVWIVDPGRDPRYLAPIPPG